ncbi:thiamine pyrophosphate-binding protein [Nocardia donostiensis]|uniref:acetolactate synthase n=1 Tax=Nocardia donostiensis TaxID=1538463 RepID=A0A1W0B976_9NOCA|nr:thiamine pyrophosphate-binding protein [Nocardia donostiensis]ONM46604.1 acetolactate synthase [Nocardia donostiensis]OQS12506.1 acetolactate synthase [Nocardia donostiensis]OQS19044.1 acetolactate synthase [Nocardia donostiensis]
MRGTVVDYLARAVSGLGVRHIFGVDGANIEDLYDAIFDNSLLTGVVAKHEFSAAAMADGYARITTRLGVVAATSGGGAMNLVAGLAESYASRVPVLALVGQPPTTVEGHGAFQDSSGKSGAIDAIRLFGSISRYCTRVESAAELPERLARAVRAARRGGPAVLLLPKNVQQAAMGEVAAFQPPEPLHWCDDSEYTRVRAMLAEARRTGKIVIIAGDQIARDDARAELARLAAVLDAAVGVAPDAKDTYDNRDPAFCGVAGTMGHPELTAALRSATLCLLVGTPLPVTARTGLDELLADTTVAGIGLAQPYPPAVHATCTDLRDSLGRLATELDPAHTGTAQPQAPDDASTHAANPDYDGRAHSMLTSLRVPEAHGPGVRYGPLVEAIGSALPAGTAVFADAGNTGAAVVHHLRVPRGGRFVVALGMGGMGYAFGAGIGAAFATGGRTVVIAGDGAFYMHGMEVHTAVEHRLPVTFVICNNNAHAMCVSREQLYYQGRYSFNRFRPARLGAGLAAMFPELRVRSVHTPDQLAAALAGSFGGVGPSLVEVDCAADEIPPFSPFLRSAP